MPDGQRRNITAEITIGSAWFAGIAVRSFYPAPAPIRLFLVYAISRGGFLILIPSLLRGTVHLCVGGMDRIEPSCFRIVSLSRRHTMMRFIMCISCLIRFYIKEMWKLINIKRVSYMKLYINMKLIVWYLKII